LLSWVARQRRVGLSKVMGGAAAGRRCRGRKCGEAALVVLMLFKNRGYKDRGVEKTPHRGLLRFAGLAFSG